MFGFGYTGIIASMKKVPSGGGNGALTTAWIAATSETNPTIISALNTLETDLTTYGLTAKIKALYPMVGGTAAKHKFNFMDARDLDAAYRLTFSGGWVHSANGALGNGVNTYANTFFQPGANFTDHNLGGIGIYSRTNETGLYLEGCDGSSMGRGNFHLYAKYTGLGAIYEAGPVTAIGTVSDSLGLTTGSAFTSTDRRVYKNGTKLATSTTTNTEIGSLFSIFFGADHTTSPASYFGNKQYAMCLITEGMTDTNQTNLYTATQAFQTTLSRQV